MKVMVFVIDNLYNENTNSIENLRLFCWTCNQLEGKKYESLTSSHL